MQENKTTKGGDRTQFRCTYNKVGDRWRTFYYCPGAGFNYGSEVYYGRNDWNTEGDAIAAKLKWEAR